MAQKARTKMSDIGIGQLINHNAQKDAVHIATIPLVALETLHPGQHIGINSNLEAVSIADKHIAIVDPFLKQPVLAGQKFWGFMYPGSIESLRHDWTHPDIRSDRDILNAFAASLDLSYDELIALGKENKEELAKQDKINKAKKWLETFAQEIPFYDYDGDYVQGKQIGYTYQHLLDIGKQAVEKQYVCVGDDSAQDYFNAHKDEFMKNISIVLEMEDHDPDDEEKRPYFSCAC